MTKPSIIDYMMDAAACAQGDHLWARLWEAMDLPPRVLCVRCDYEQESSE